VPESLLVRGQMELEYRNFSDDTLSEIYFRLDLNTHSPNGYCRIDSMLYYGAPLTEDEISVDNAIMKISLPSKLAPEATGFFLIAFESRVASLHASSLDEGHDESHNVTFYRWYPCVCPYKDGRWYTDEYTGYDRSTGEYARYNVALQIDSAYSIAHPGKLLNEKEHYGFLPKGVDDTVYVDLVNKHSFAFGGVRYHPEFPSGHKWYFVRARNATDFSFVVGPQFIRDRTYRDSLTIEVCYGKEVQKVWAGFAARSTLGLIKQYEKWLGKFPHNNLTVVAGEGPDENHRSQQILVLPANITDSSLLYATLAVELANCWLSPVLPDSSGAGQWFDEGLAYYVAIRALYDSFGAEGYEMIREHRKFMFRRSNENELSRQFVARVFHELPSQIHALRFLVGDSTLREALQEDVRRFRYEFPYATDFPDIVEELTDQRARISFDEWMRTGNVFDFGVSKMKTERTEGEYVISFEVKNFGSTVMPVEIGYVISATDTIYDTLQYNRLPSPGGSSVFRKTIPRRPKAVALDPNHYLPDIDRGNNYSFTLPVRFRYHSPKTLFPPFDDLR
ncbi:MAG: hypothetical protein KAT58_05050, partial [candidate division Zixibacteria bacterium]|nr:hypothetical protein [candidate division Zixibacteria bacterium]